MERRPPLTYSPCRSWSVCQFWVNVHVACTVSDILRHKHHVVPATLPLLHVFARGSRAHADFLAKNKGRIKSLFPTSAQA